MADEKVELRDVNFRQLLPWTELFRGFQVALDPKKLLLAAAGIVFMAAGWWLFAFLFYNARTNPHDVEYRLEDYQTGELSEDEARRRLEADRKSDQYKYDLLKDTAGPNGTLNRWPWDEDRGPNPYLLVMNWLSGKPDDLQPQKQLLVLLEPLVKFLMPIIYLLKSDAGFINYLYFFLVMVWTLATWALFGGAITRMAAVQLARKEKISIKEAMHFAWSRYVSYFSAPLFPMLFVLGILVMLIVFGALHMIPVFGDIVVDGLGWPLNILASIVMAVILVGLVGWPMMYATISTEGSDSFDALSRSYSYVFQCPWHYLWNSAVAIVYGAALVFFVGFMGSFMAYLGKWGMSQTPGIKKADREPHFLFVYAPKSYQWRDLLLQGSPAVDADGRLDPVRYEEYLHGEDKDGKLEGGFQWYNYVGAGMVAFWTGLLFLMVLGFGYSYFWCASTIIYLLMRRQVDDTELDEVYLEEDEGEDTYVSPSSAAAAQASAQTLTMVDAPKLRTPGAPPPPAAPAPAPTPPAKAETGAAPGDGNPPVVP